MPTAVITQPIDTEDRADDNAAKLKLYTMIGEGYQAMLDGRESPLEDVKRRVEDRRKSHG